MKIGTRGSPLALAQSRQATAALAARLGHEPELVVITTEGDRSTAPLASIGGTGVFVSALREALLAGEVDALVHSYKDLPTAAHEGLVVAAVPRRADARDALVARDGMHLETLPDGSRVGTGSPRRVAQLSARRPDLEIVPLRGNVDSRLARVEHGELDAVVVAAAGLERLGRADSASQLLGIDGWPTAPAQGALAIEVRAGDEQLVSSLNHAASRLTAEAERRALALVEAGCSAPLGAHALVDDGMLFLSVRVYALDGSRHVTSSHALYLADSRDPVAEIADRVATELMELGAAELLENR